MYVLGTYYIRMYVRMYLCINVCMYVRTYICIMYVYMYVYRLRWSRGSMLAFSTQVHGFKPIGSRRIFRAKKILSMHVNDP
jgi:hypothetical protein